ncbi:M23 family metallopeptidase [Candidatus Epulonipiscium viviparus]|uniref:M23 family metallopeptidase n=1 Tax=Candidatus Epulonipiscium viviparus TaxID=420336 RepID=UPI0027380E3A|nr:M23 family metallopeptidase [Candidatus Epulopiscium viviparus]
MKLLRTNNDKNMNTNKISKMMLMVLLFEAAFMGGHGVQVYAAESSYQVFFDNELVGIVKNESDAYEAFLEMENNLEEKEGRSIQIQNKFDTKKVADSNQNLLTQDKLIDILSSKVDYLVEAYELTIDGKVVGIVNDEQEALELLSEVASGYMHTLSNDTSVAISPKAAMTPAIAGVVPITIGAGISTKEAVTDQFSITNNTIKNTEKPITLTDEKIKTLSEEVDIYSDKPAAIVAESLEITQEIGGRILYAKKESINPETVVDALLADNFDAINYTLKSGDTLSNIARQYDTTTNNLLALNPQIKNANQIKVGETITVSKSAPKLETQLIEKATFIEKIPAEIEYKANSNMLKGEEKIIKQGKDGVKEIYVEIIKVNGKEVGRSIIDEKILYNEVKTVIEYGTKTATAGTDSNVVSSSKSMFMHPLNGEGWMSSAYGPRWGTFHGGIDFAAVAGTNIYAAASGTVTYSTYNYGGYGNLVIIDHGNGYETYYAHNSRNYVKVGDKVSKGQHIAEVGSTGDSTGNHIHFEIRKNGVRQNPANYITY